MGTDRVAVIGAGAAGLSAAHMLRKRGYANVTVFERADRVGGKCETVSVDGRNYELGAAIQTPAYVTIREIMRDVGIASRRVFSMTWADVDRRRLRALPEHALPHRLPGLALAFVRLLRELRRERRIFQPGLDRMPRELCQPLSEWARSRGVAELVDLLSVSITGFGYGYANEVPAAYILKYIALMLPGRELLETGYQGLWQRVAERLDVRLGSQIQRIERGTRVAVHTAEGREDFDRLILACPLDDAARHMDTCDEEGALLSRIRYYDYHVCQVRAVGLPTARYGYLPGRQRSTCAGQTMFWYRRWPDRDVINFYSLGRASEGMRERMDLATIRRGIEADVAQLGGRITRHLTDRTWKYFPHVGSADMLGGYYDRLEALQGQRHTHYAGELLNFSTVETVAAYSKALVERHFA